ncbi:hypothetical protein HBB16_01545 [Pseudonocardia sp. MCCB 268]|nr:hypothetical protein [Pseudonocardia cytotoxica]
MADTLGRKRATIVAVGNADLPRRSPWVCSRAPDVRCRGDRRPDPATVPRRVSSSVGVHGCETRWR